MTRRCRHRFTPWSELITRESWISYDQQERTCTRCNLIERRNV